MPQHIDTPTAEIDVHKGTYQVGTAPKTLKQKSMEARQASAASIAGRTKQKVVTFNDPAAREKIKQMKASGAPLSFSDQ